MDELLQDYFGEFGGQFAAETLMEPLEELSRGFRSAVSDPDFSWQLSELNKHYIGRESPLTLIERTSEQLGGARIWLKREDLNHTGAHKINNAIGQAPLAKKMGKTRLIAETGAGQHGVATATAGALFGLKVRVYMGAADAARQAPNVSRMKLLGAEVFLVEAGKKTMKEAINEAMRDWIANVKDTHYLIGSAIGPAPFPSVVRYFQKVIGDECRRQIMERAGGLPDLLVACVGGGSNAIGLFQAFLEDQQTRILGVQAGGCLENGVQLHSAPLIWGRPGVLHGSRTQLLQNEDGQILETHSIAPGLDYPGVGPEHSYLKASGRADYKVINDSQALEAFGLLCRNEGIIPALESSHALAAAFIEAKEMKKDENIVVNLSGRGDKDLDTVFAQMSQKKSESEESDIEV